VAGSLIQSGESFSIGDGLHPQQKFGFTKGGAMPGLIPIVIGDGARADEVAKAIVRAVNHAPLSVFAELGAPGRVILNNVVGPPGAGALGNQLIREWVQDPGFRVEGMSGGGGRDCPEGGRCRYGEDCVSGGCRDGFCVP
jgi:hypothetical protein